MLKDFKTFIASGNVLDLAVAVIMGAAFGAVVTSMVNDIVMPPIGRILGGVDFKDLFLSLNGQSYPTLAAAKTAAPPVIAYGQFLNTVINFLIIALVIFLLFGLPPNFRSRRLLQPRIAASVRLPFHCWPRDVLTVLRS